LCARRRFAVISWTQIVEALVALAFVAGVVFWIHRASVRRAEKGVREPESHS